MLDLRAKLSYAEQTAAAHDEHRKYWESLVRNYAATWVEHRNSLDALAAGYPGAETRTAFSAKRYRAARKALMEAAEVGE